MHLPENVLRLLPRRSGTGDPVTKRDRRIAERLQDLFEADLALSRMGGLQFFVHRGSVFLQGSSMDRDDLSAIKTIIEGVPEVRRVVDRQDSRATHAA